MEILESEQRRARNLIWNTAGDYSFEPDFKAYDSEGRADLYWNSIIGAARRICGADALQTLFASFHGCKDEAVYEQLVWLGLENAVYQLEAPLRPALPVLRQRYARWVLSLCANQPLTALTDILEQAHFLKAVGQTPALSPREAEMLRDLEFSSAPDAAPLPQQALAFLNRYFGFTPGKTQAEEQSRAHHFPFPFFRRRGGGLPAVRSFGHGFGEHISSGGGTDASPPIRRLTDRNAAQTEAALQDYIQKYFGPPLYDSQEVRDREKSLCTGDHAGCHLYYTKGSTQLDPAARGYAASQRRLALQQMERNKAAYQADLLRHRAGIARLTARIRNAMMAYLQPTVVRSASGTLDAGRIWRGVYLNDDKVFTRVLQSDPGELCVDLLLDASTSQVNRQETVSAQGYMIAESLTRCGIPVRVSSFCSLSGYTILTRFRDYGEPDANERIFKYFTTGCNRDGLAIRAMARELEDAPCEHQLLILLSDAKPSDVIKVRRGQSYVDYAGTLGIQNTAAEVRSLLRRDISVICVFTGDDEDVPSAHTIYGRDFARIRSLDQFADTVGTLIQNQIRAL